MRLTMPAVVVATVLVFPQPARAAALTFVKVLSTSMLTSTSLTPFDPSLGSLDRVDVAISGWLIVDVEAPANKLVVPRGFHPPLPYPILVSVGQRFAGVGGYFEFASNAVLSASPLVPGVQVTFPVQMDYAYAFAFTSATDLNGYTLPTSSGVIPPLWISGTRSDFNDHLLFPNMKRVTHAASVVPLGVVILDGPLYVSQVRGTAVITLKYTYTPSSEPPIDPGVPEPASALLLMAGASVVLARHGWRRRRRP